MIQIKKQILVVNENIAVCQTFQERMQNDHTDVICVQSKVKALEIFMKQECCLIIFDIQSSGADSVEMLHIMHSTQRTPVLALIPPLSTEDRVALFHAGADVCLDKASDIEICVAQAEALIQIYLEASKKQGKRNLIVFGSELIINPRYRQVIADGKALDLTRKEFDLLHCLASYPGQVFSREQLYDHVWNDRFAESGDETVRVHLQTLRKKLLAAGKDFIQNIWGVGYRFVPPQQDELL